LSLDEVKGIHLIDNIETAWECQRWMSTCDEIAVDTEGTGLNTRIDKVRLLQFGDRQTAYCIPIDFPGWGAFGADMLKRFQGTYVAHNLTYDADMIRGTLGYSLPESRCHDTRLMSHVLESTGSTALKILTRRLVDRRAGNFQHQLDDAMKAGGWNWATVPIDLEAYWMYGGLDTILTMQLKDELYPRVMAEAPKSYELELAVSWVARRMENKGVVVDREYTQKLMDELDAYVKSAEKWCHDVHGISPGANAKVIEKLQSFGVEFTKMTGGGQYSLDKEVLESIDHPLAATVLNRRRAQKMVSTYLANYLTMSEWDGKIHPSINTVGGTDKNPFEPGGGSGVRTGRMSMSDPNMQNVPTRTKFGKKIRNCFLPSIDHQWAKADFGQIEMRVMAHMSQDPGMIAAFLTPGDFFVNLGVQLFHEPDFVKSDPRRQLLKNGGYAKIYGAGIPKFAKTAGVPEDEAGKFMRDFDKTYERVPQWVKEVESEGRANLNLTGEAYVRSPLTGRKHTADAGKLYTLVNYVIQGTAGEILKMKIVEADAAGLGPYMMIPVHDEIDFDVPNDDFDDIIRTIESVMNDDQLLTVPITSSIDIAQRWGECG
jgi:DNA polymerase I-like protein with 3'-5' exonuclease and polymerase domains